MDKLRHINDELAKMLHSGLELTLQQLPLPDINLALLFLALLFGLFALLVMCMLTPEGEDLSPKGPTTTKLKQS
jgi:hypothetical protein